MKACVLCFCIFGDFNKKRIHKGAQTTTTLQGIERIQYVIENCYRNFPFLFEIRMLNKIIEYLRVEEYPISKYGCRGSEHVTPKYATVVY